MFENTQVDAYSFGVLMWEIETGEVPFEGYEEKAIWNLLVEQKMRPRIPDKTETNLAALIRKCWHENPKRRPEFREIINQLDKVTFS